MRILCELFGCREAEDAPCCVRCGEPAIPEYGGQFIEHGRLSPLTVQWRLAVLAIKDWLHPPVCEVCGKHLTKEQKYLGVCDDPVCETEWFPF